MRVEEGESPEPEGKKKAELLKPPNDEACRLLVNVEEICGDNLIGRSTSTFFRDYMDEVNHQIMGGKYHNFTRNSHLGR